jgi:midasin
VTQYARSIKHLTGRVVDALEEARRALEAYNSLEPDQPASQQLLRQVDQLKGDISALHNRMIELVENISKCELPFALKGMIQSGSTYPVMNIFLAEATLLSDALKRIENVSDEFQTWSNSHPHLNYIFDPVIHWLKAEKIPLPPAEKMMPASLHESGGQVVDALLVVIQNLIAQIPERSKSLENSEDEEDNYLAQEIASTSQFTKSLALEKVSKALAGALPNLLARPDTAKEQLLMVKPFLDLYVSMAHQQLSCHLKRTTALYKLAFVLNSIMLRLSKEGFCQPPLADEEDEGGEAGESSGGMGLGEGTGTENVSKEIEDESQVEGLKNESEVQQSDAGKEKRDDDGTIEMGDDFEGDLEDVSEKEEDDDNSDDNAENGSEVDLEERVEDLDPNDPNAVDEKLWGDEKGPESGQKDEDKVNEDRGGQQEGDSEVVAKEGERKSNKEKGNQQEKRESEPNYGEENEETMADMEEDQEQPGAEGAPMDEHVPDAETLDLPDDMDLGEAENKEDSTPEVEDDGQDAMMEEEGDPGPSDEQIKQDQWVPEERPSGVEEESMDELNDNEETSHSVEDSGGVDDLTDEQDKNQVTARPDLSSSGDGDTVPDHDQSLDKGINTATGQGDSKSSSDEQNKQDAHQESDSHERY